MQARNRKEELTKDYPDSSNDQEPCTLLLKSAKSQHPVAKIWVTIAAR
jgi:hypothetical protein